MDRSRKDMTPDERRVDKAYQQEVIARRRKVQAEIDLENAQEQFENQLMGAARNPELASSLDPDTLVAMITLFSKELRKRAE